ncbi:MAG TPA: saccharopine dehydrogenase [Rhodobacteraceae bacterium]|nr:saccharopine dehydrogenase [Paracoccaceae bacterium]
MAHLWIRSEQRANEKRVGLTPQGAAKLIAAGHEISVEESPNRIIPTEEYRDAGCRVEPENSWPDAPGDAIVFGLKELPDDGTPLAHRHIMFGHAYKGQPAGRALLERFRKGGGTLYDLEYLTDENGRRVAAFGYWAGFAGAAVSMMCLAAQQAGRICGLVATFASSEALVNSVRKELDATGQPRPSAIVIGALGRVGTGARDLCKALGIETTDWDMAETARGGPFPEILDHDVFINAILAAPGCPVFVGADATTAPRRLRVIGDVACDPTSEFSPIKVYDRVTTWEKPALRVHDDPPLDVMAIDNLPSLLPLESSIDFADQLLPSLLSLDDMDKGVWARAKTEFDLHVANLQGDET